MTLIYLGSCMIQLNRPHLDVLQNKHQTEIRISKIFIKFLFQCFHYLNQSPDEDFFWKINKLRMYVYTDYICGHVLLNIYILKKIRTHLLSYLPLQNNIFFHLMGQVSILQKRNFQANNKMAYYSQSQCCLHVFFLFRIYYYYGARFLKYYSIRRFIKRGK